MDTRVLLFALLVLFIQLDLSSSSECHTLTPTYGNPNNFPILKFPQAKLLNTVKNGKSYQITVPNGGNSSSFYVTHLWGNAYEMGIAQGTLYKDEIHKFISDTWEYFLEQFEEIVPFFPTWLQELVATVGLDAALDFTEWATRSYSSPHFYEEMRGLADATGLDIQLIIRVHMIPSFTQGQCSLFGAWGKAVGNTGKLYQLRALDWDMDGPFRDYSAITVYHPNHGEGHAFASIGMIGFIGGLTGLSETQLGISEIGIAMPDETFGDMSRIGQPFVWLLRDILQFDYTIDDAINRMINTRRTCDLTLAVGDGKSVEFRAMEYSYSVLDILDDKNMRPYNQTWHPRFDNLVYLGMDWLCYGYNYVMSQQLGKYYGQLTPEIAIQNISSVEQSGTNHIAFYNLVDMHLYVSFAAPHNVGEPLNAYDRQYTLLDANALFAESKPTLF